LKKALDLDKTEPAATYRTEPRVMANGGQFVPKPPGGVEDRSALRDLHRLSIDHKLRHWELLIL
jgi:hypothetical protein